jgi:hypothetical protein
LILIEEERSFKIEIKREYVRKEKENSPIQINNRKRIKKTKMRLKI